MALLSCEDTLPVPARFVDTQEILENIRQAWNSGHDLVALKGVGNGEWLSRFAEGLLAEANLLKGIVIIEPNPLRLLDVLRRQSIDAVIASRYALWCIGENWERQWDLYDASMHLGGVASPVALPVYTHIPPEEAAAQERINDTIQQRIASHLGRLRAEYVDAQRHYADRAPGIKHVWMPLNEKDRATVFVLRGLADGLRSQGIEVTECRIPPDRFVSARMGNWSILKARPDLVVTANRPLSYGLGDLAEAVPVPQVTWFTDAPVFDLATPRTGKWDVICCFDSYYIPALSQRVQREVHVLQGAANLLEPAEADTALNCQVSCVGSVARIETILSPLSKTERDYVRGWAEARARDRFMDLDALVAQEPPPERLRNSPAHQVAGLIYAVANALYRRWGVEKLVDFDLSLWGGDAWLEGEPENSRIRKAYKGYISDPRQLAALYRSSDIHVSLHSLTAIRGLNMHAWNAPIQETFLLTEALPGISDAFVPGEELACFNSLEALPGEVDRWLADPQGRAGIAAAGRERVLREHTFPVRARQLLNIAERWSE